MRTPDTTTPIVLEFVRTTDAADAFAFQFQPQEYLLRRADGVFAPVQIPWNQALLEDLAVLRQAGRDPAAVQRIGERLRSWLEPAGWSTLEAQILDAQHRGLRVALQIRAAAAELYALPWELLSLRGTGQHLGELAHVTIQYEWPRTEEGPLPDEDAGGTGLLLAWSAAGGSVPAAEHVALLEQACGAAALPFVPTRDVLAHASYDRLRATLAAATDRGEPVRVLHLLCHGGETGSTYGLCLHSDEGDGLAVVDAGRLRQLLGPFAGTLRLVVLSACDSGNSGTPGNQLGSVAQTLHRAGIAAVVGSRYPLSRDGSLRAAAALYGRLISDTASLDQALRAVRQALAQCTDGLDWASLQLYAHPIAMHPEFRPLTFRPYRGLLSFQPQHARYLFGRSAEIAAMEQKLTLLRQSGQPRLLSVMGASGAGKSSLVLAGVVPRLQGTQRSGSADAGDGTAGPALQLRYLRPGGDALMDVQSLAAAPMATAPTLIVIDQLEEIFTQLSDPAQRQAFVQALWQIATAPNAQHVVLMTLRIDFAGRCGELTLTTEGLRLDAVAFSDPHRVLVAQLGPADLRATVTEPARRVGLTLEEGLLSRILADVAGEPGALPLLQDTLDLLWQRRRAGMLTVAAYEAVGGVGGALQRRADAVIDGLSVPEARAARSLLVRLVHMTDSDAPWTRQRMRLSALRPQGEAEQAAFAATLQRLVAARLVVCDGVGDGQVVEVAHEALIRRWPRLQAWVKEDRQLLWETARVEELLGRWHDERQALTGAALTFAQGVAARSGAALSPEARRLVRLFSIRARRQLALSIMSALLVVASLLFDAISEAPLPHRYRMAQDVLLSACVLGLLGFATNGFSLLGPRRRTARRVEAGVAGPNRM